MAWTVLFVAGLFEIGWAVGLKYTEGFTRPLVTAATIGSMVVSMGLLGVAVRTLPLGTAYAVWTGIGTVGTAVLGIVLFREPAGVLRLVCIGLITAGIVGLKLVSDAGGHASAPPPPAAEESEAVALHPLPEPTIVIAAEENTDVGEREATPPRSGDSTDRRPAG